MRRETVIAKIRELETRLKRADRDFEAAQELQKRYNRLVEEHEDLHLRYKNLAQDHLKLLNDIEELKNAMDEMRGMGYITGGYMENGDPWHLGPLNKPGDRCELNPAQLARYVDTLLELRRMNDPDVPAHMAARAANATGNPEVAEAAARILARGPAFMKTEFADTAVTIACELFRALAEWAIDHQIGIELENPAGSGLAEGDLADLDPRTNAHRFELLGRDIRWNDITPFGHQQIAGYLMHLLTRLYPRETTRRIATAMYEVMTGSEPAIFQPIRRRRGKERNPFIGWLLRALAIGHVNYLIACGTAKVEAIEAVAGAYGVLPGTLRNWADRLPDVLGHTNARMLLLKGIIYLTPLF